MSLFSVRIFSVVTGLLLMIAATLTIAGVERAPVSVLFSLLMTSYPLVRAWRAANGTALRSAVVWAGIAIGLAVVSQILAIGQPLTSGRPTTAYCTYLATLATLATLFSILGARTPGAGAWAILMVMLIVVFLIPWLEGRLRLEQPWGLFYWLLVIAGVTNYLPTKFRVATFWLTIGFFTEYRALTATRIAPTERAILESIIPLTLVAGVIAAERAACRTEKPRSRLEAIWFWFRDHWGVVWTLRVQERFNKFAATQGWPIRLTWHGVIALTNGELIIPDAAEATLRGLLRRFANPARIDQAVAERVE